LNEEQKGRVWGYARVSTEDQSLDMQRQALEQVGCHHIFEEKVSGAAQYRQQFETMLKTIRPGDVLVVWKLDRLGRKLIEVSELCEMMREQNIEFRSLTEAVDTTTPIGRMFFHFLALFAQFEREMTAERTKAGMAAKRAQGQKFGRKPMFNDRDVAAILADVSNPLLPMADIADKWKCSKATLNNYFPGVRQEAIRRLADETIN